MNMNENKGGGSERRYQGGEKGGEEEEGREEGEGGIGDSDSWVVSDGEVRAWGNITFMRRNQFPHRYCDDLDGVSLAPVLQAAGAGKMELIPQTPLIPHMSQIPRRKAFPFAVTQKMMCKAAGHLKNFPDKNYNTKNKSAKSAGTQSELENELKMKMKMVMVDPELYNPEMTDVHTAGWSEFCPFKQPPELRNPALGVMGYSLRTRYYRYTAWLVFDTGSLLPFLDRPPLGEELYDHRERDKDVISGPFTSTSTSTSKNKGTLVITSGLTGKELHNHANSSAQGWTSKKTSLRLQLYDFLYYNSTFSHHFHARLAEQQDLLLQLNDRKNEMNARYEELSRSSRVEEAENESNTDTSTSTGTSTSTSTGIDTDSSKGDINRKGRGKTKTRNRNKSNERGRSGQHSDAQLDAIVKGRSHEQHPHQAWYSTHYYRADYRGTWPDK